MLADLVLILHAAFVAFVVLGAFAVVIGRFRRWAWTRNRTFRLAHLAAIVYVAVQSLLGWMCPLTVLEDRLRGAQTETGFVARWLRALLYYDFPGWMFTAAYAAFALFVLALYRWAPPAPRHPR
ncbi:MAG: DUF2784 domain-containing protein [Burkholderiales bacterium]|nr:DUF2784 domain-containing protein [Burkholderiales bacterium]